MTGGLFNLVFKILEIVVFPLPGEPAMKRIS